MSQAQRLGRSDRYRLLHQFAQDRIGSWWTAKDGILHRTVTVRVVGDELSSNKRFVERLQWHVRELIRPILVDGTLHPRLRHPCIPWILDHSSPADVTQFLVLPSIQGELLVERLRTEGALTYGEAARIAAEAAEALQAAHESNIVHGGLHTGNVILSPDGSLSIVDFGIAAAAREVGRRDEDPRDVEMAISSELTGGSELSAASDVAALGALLYQMLTGRSFAEDALRTASALPSVPRFPSNLPDQIMQACVLALSAEPSARDLSVALQPIASATPPRSGGVEETPETGASVRRADTRWTSVSDSPAANGETDSPREPSVREADPTPAEPMPVETSLEARASVQEANRGPKAVVAEHGTLNGSVTDAESKMDRRLGAGRWLPPTAGGKLSGASTERALRSGALSDGSSQSPEVENVQPVDRTSQSNSRGLALRRMLGSRSRRSQLIVSVGVIVVVALGGAAIDRFRSDGPELIPSRSGASNRPAIVPATENPPEGDLVVVPNTIGLSAREARQRLITDGLQFLEARPTQGTPGVVLGSDPPAGVSVPQATGVILMVGVSPDRWIPSSGVP